MKIGLTEKQYIRVLSYVSENQEIKEDDEVPSAEPETGTNAQQSGGQGYPAVGKWESGVTRGPANQIGISKWSDIVGSTLKRDKANQLKEQIIYSPSIATIKAGQAVTAPNRYIKLKNPNGVLFYVPKGTKVLNTFEKGDRWDDGLKNWVDKVKGGLGNAKTNAWLPKDSMNVVGWVSLFPHLLGSVSQFKTPNGEIYSTFFVNEDLQKIKTWKEFYNTEPNLRAWKMVSYRTSSGKIFKIDEFDSMSLSVIDWFKENYKDLLWIAAAIVAGILTGGLADVAIGGAFMSGASAGVASTMMARVGLNVSIRALSMYLAEAGVWSIKAGMEFHEGKSLTGSIDLVFGWLLPLCHGTYFKMLGLGNITEKEVAELGTKLVGKGEQELTIVLENLTQRETEILTKISATNSKKFGEVISQVFIEAESKLVAQGKVPATVLQKYLLNAGEFINKKWYAKLYLTFKHDMLLISVIHEIEKKFGVEDRLSKDQTIEGLIRLRQESPDDAAFNKTASDLIKNSKSYEEIQQKIQDKIGMSSEVKFKKETKSHKASEISQSLDDFNNEN
jgi:hypothetical protein